MDALGFGTRADLLQRLAEYREVGVAIALVPNAASDPGAERTLAALATG